VAPKVTVVSAEVRDQKLHLHLKNEGKAHQLLEKLEIQFQLDGKDQSLSAKDLNEARSENILAGGERELVIPVEKKFAKAKVKVT
jgi:archaellum component FlaG (FlaF/FlaG flagellin family)